GRWMEIDTMVRAGALLGGGGIVVVLAVGVEPVPVVVELRVLDHDVAGVGARVALGTVFAVHGVDDHPTGRTRTDVEGRVVHIRRVVAVEDPGPAGGVPGVNAGRGRGLVGAIPVGRGGGQIGPAEGLRRLLARGAAAVEPDRVADGQITAQQVDS